MTMVPCAVIRGRGAKRLGGAAASPTTSTCTAASASAEVMALYFADSTTCTAKQIAQMNVSASPHDGRAWTPPMSMVVPITASSDPIQARPSMRARYSSRSQNGTRTTYRPVRNADREGEMVISPRVWHQ